MSGRLSKLLRFTYFKILSFRADIFAGNQNKLSCFLTTLFTPNCNTAEEKRNNNNYYRR